MYQYQSYKRDYNSWANRIKILFRPIAKKTYIPKFTNYGSEWLEDIIRGNTTEMYH